METLSGLIHQMKLGHFLQHFVQLCLIKDISPSLQNDFSAYFQWLHHQQWFLLGEVGLDFLVGQPSAFLGIHGMHANSWPVA